MATHTTLASLFTDIADSIRAKTGKTDNIVADDFPEEIAGITTGGSTVTPGDINFYDYDGTLVASWTLEELATATELPANPSHTGLTAQGWNWTLADLKTTNRAMNVGQMYITDDGKTRLYITIAAPGRMTVPLYIQQTVANGVTIDWGDGSATETLAGTGNVNTTHTYADIGSYMITLTPASGCELGFGNGTDSYCVLGSTGNNGKVYCNMLQKVEIGSGVTSIGSSAFQSCYSLSSITIPDGVTGISDKAFNECYSLSSITIPDGVTSISYKAFNECYSLSSITIPDGVTSISDEAFNECHSLSNITIPDSVTSIGIYAFYGCYSLSSITIPDSVTIISGSAFYECYSLSSITIPDSVTIISGSAFNECYSLSSITIPDSVTSISGYTFFRCYSLSSITIPDTVTSIGGSAFQSCYSLSSITIPDTVTSIGSSAFQSCYSLSSITIPDGVTNIDAYAFSNCYGMAEYHLKPTTPPTLSNTNAFGNIPSDCIIYVPAGCLSAYQTATNWSSYASYMQEEPA